MKKILGMILVTTALSLSVGCTKEQPYTPKEESFNRLEFRNRLKRHVVKVMGLEGGHGSGFVTIKDNKSYIISNRHVCNMQPDEDYMYIQYAESKAKHLVRKIKTSKVHDLCALEGLRSPAFGGLNLADREPVKGEDVYSFGFPLDSSALMMDGEFVDNTEIFLQKNREKDGSCNGIEKEFATFFGTFLICGDNYPAFQTTNAVYPGNSGSALVNKKGEVIGVIFAGTSTVIENYSVPLDYLKEFVEGL